MCDFRKRRENISDKIQSLEILTGRLIIKFGIITLCFIELTMKIKQKKISDYCPIRGILTTIFVSMVILISCSTQKIKEQENSNVEDISLKNNGAYYTIVEFEKGRTFLSEENKKELKDFLLTASHDRKSPTEIKILVWADREYSPNISVINKEDERIAESRKKEIENYLRNLLFASSPFSSFNMVKSPDKINEFLYSENRKTKKVFEKTGSLPTLEGGDIASLIEHKASKALILMNYE